MKQFNYNRILVGLICIGLLAALTVVWQRHKIELASQQVEMVMEYEDVVELAQMEGIPLPKLLQEFKQAGLTSLAVYETTLEKLHKSGKVTVLSGADVLHQYRSGLLDDAAWRELLASGRIIPEDVYIVGHDVNVFREVQEDLARRLGPERVSVIDGQRQIIAAKANYEKVLKWNLGLPTDEMKAVAENGFYIVARPTNYTKVREQDVDAVFARMNGIEPISAIMFVGDEALGHPDYMPRTLEHIKSRNLTVALIEHPLQLQFFKQESLVPLAVANDYKAARVYVIPKDEQPKLKLAEAVQRWVVTDQERNIRINLLRKFDKPEPGKTLVATNLEYVAGVRDGLMEKGFTLGRAGTFTPYFPPRVLLAAMLLGATAAGVLFLTLVRPFAPRYQYALVAVITVVLAFPLLKGSSGTLVRQMAALSSAIIFPVLAMTWQLDRWEKCAPHKGGSLRRIMVDGIGSLTVTVLLSMVGGMYVAALLGDVRFFLEMEIFRGVKLTFVAPLILITLTYLSRYQLFEEPVESVSVWEQLKKLLNYPVYIKSLLAFGMVAIAAWVFVGRSGHTAGVPVPAIELKMRAFLERIMYARPREKEFLIGHPAFFLAVMAAYRQWPRVAHYVLVVVATIAQGSLVETFAHLRTPVFMSFVRGLDGLVAGIAFGLMAVIGVQVLRYLSFLLGRRSA